MTTLRVRLSLTGDCGGKSVADPTLYDASLVRAVQTFQRRHGIRSDGVVGDATRDALNVSVHERIAQLDRARLGSTQPLPTGRWIRINVPGFWLQVLDGEHVVLEMPVVVGRPSRPTPLFEKPLSAIVFNPAWTVPPDLAYHDLLPKIIADPSYLAQRQIDVYASWEPGAARLDPRGIDWQRLGARIEGLTLRKRPGPGNGLGRMMFRMEAEPEIFLHDTPAREVFRQDRRDLSSGCIRVADAEGLARAVLDAGARADLPAFLARRDTFAVPLPHPVPVRTVYETAWVDARGTVNFRDDIYDADARMAPASKQAAVPRREPSAPAWPGNAAAGLAAAARPREPRP